MADTTKNKGWKIIAVIAGSLAGIWAIGWLITGKGNPLTWFATTPKEGDDCKTADGKDGKLDASGNCVANAGQRVVINERENLNNQILSRAPRGFDMNIGRNKLNTLNVSQLKNIVSHLSGTITEVQLRDIILGNNSEARSVCGDGWRCNNKCVGFWDWLFCA